MNIVFFYGLIFIVFIAIVLYKAKNQQKLNAEIQAFAMQKGLAYQARAMAESVITEPDIFDARLQVADLVVDPSGAQTFLLSATRREGKEQISLYFLGSKHAVKNQASFTLLPTNANMNFYRFNGLSPLKFESDDLNRIFRLAVKPGDEVNTLELLSPNMMLWLVQQAPNSIVVARPGGLYVFMPKVVSPFESQFNIINAIADYLVAHISG